MQFAKLLDFYEIEWEYEPTTFDSYIEITTLNQKLVTKKNRKARRLQELYPGVKCRVLYQRDYLNLLVKYGLEPPSQQMPEPVQPVSREDAEPPSFLGLTG